MQEPEHIIHSLVRSDLVDYLGDWFDVSDDVTETDVEQVCDRYREILKSREQDDEDFRQACREVFGAHRGEGLSLDAVGAMAYAQEI